MAHNSLFAILLRSRWWISIALAALVTLVSTALLPKDIAPFAAITALPFFGIGCVAAWRQLRAPSPAKVEQALEIAAQQSWREFADRLDRAWQAERSEEHTSELQSPDHLVCRLLLEKKKKQASNREDDGVTSTKNSSTDYNVGHLLQVHHHIHTRTERSSNAHSDSVHSDLVRARSAL